MVLFLFLGIISSEFVHCSCGFSPSASACVVAVQREIPWEQPLSLHSCPYPPSPQGMMMGPLGALILADAVLAVDTAVALWSLCMYAYASYSVVSILCGPLDYSLPRLFCPWDFSGKKTGVDCHFLLQGVFPTQESNLHLCLLHFRLIFLSAEPSGKPVESSYLETKAVLLVGLTQHTMRRASLVSVCGCSPIHICVAWPGHQELGKDCIVLSYLRSLSQPLFSSCEQNFSSK